MPGLLAAVNSRMLLGCLVSIGTITTQTFETLTGENFGKMGGDTGMPPILVPPRMRGFLLFPLVVYLLSLDYFVVLPGKLHQCQITERVVRAVIIILMYSHERMLV